jgi:hypothetical protein
MRIGRGVLMLCWQRWQWEWQEFRIDPAEDVAKEVEDRAIGVEATEVSNKLPEEWVNAKDNETWLSLGKPGKDETNKLEEWAIGVEAKEESNKLLVEGANTNNNEARVFLGKPAEDGTKELEDKGIGVEAKEVSDEMPVEGPDAQRSLYFMFPPDLVGR